MTRHWLQCYWKDRLNRLLTSCQMISYGKKHWPSFSVMMVPGSYKEGEKLQ